MPQSGAVDVPRFASPAAARPRLPRNRHGVSPIGGMCRAVPSTHISARQ